MTATFQYNRSEYQNDWEEYSLTAGVGNSQQPQGLVLDSEFNRHPDGTPAHEFDSRGVFVRGIINDVGDGWAGPTNNPTIAHPDDAVTRVVCLDQATRPEGAVFWLEWERGEPARGGWGITGEVAWRASEAWGPERTPPV